MAKAPSNVNGWAGDGNVWFKVYEIPMKTDGGKSISFPAENLAGVSFPLPKSLPSGQYLVRMEAIALHVASSFGGAQFYVRTQLLSETHRIEPSSRFLVAKLTLSAVETATLVRSSPSLVLTLATSPEF